MAANWNGHNGPPLRAWNPIGADVALEDIYAAAGAIGLLAAQIREPDAEWASEWAIKFGELMAEKARQRREKSR